MCILSSANLEVLFLYFEDSILPATPIVECYPCVGGIKISDTCRYNTIESHVLSRPVVYTSIQFYVCSANVFPLTSYWNTRDSLGLVTTRPGLVSRRRLPSAPLPASHCTGAMLCVCRVCVSYKWINKFFHCNDQMFYCYFIGVAFLQLFFTLLIFIFSFLYLFLIKTPRGWI